MTSRILLALDGMSLQEATKIALFLRKQVAGGKANDLIDEVGASALNGMGFSIRFLDPKIKDIPSTVANRMAKYAGNAEFVTVHASNSFASLRAAAKTAKQCNLKAIAVTVTTDIGSEQCKAIYGLSTRKKVLQSVRRAKRAGLSGIVCSVKEVRAVRKAWPRAIIIVPGVRSKGANAHDQKRVGTPFQAIIDGADYIVCGRQILDNVRPLDMQIEAGAINTEVFAAELVLEEYKINLRQKLH